MIQDAGTACSGQQEPREATGAVETRRVRDLSIELFDGFCRARAASSAEGAAPWPARAAVHRDGREDALAERALTGLPR